MQQRILHLKMIAKYHFIRKSKLKLIPHSKSFCLIFLIEPILKTMDRSLEEKKACFHLKIRKSNFFK